MQECRYGEEGEKRGRRDGACAVVYAAVVCIPCILTYTTYFPSSSSFLSMQFVILKPLLTLLACILESNGVYGNGEFRGDRGYVYVGVPS